MLEELLEQPIGYLLVESEVRSQHSLLADLRFYLVVGHLVAKTEFLSEERAADVTIHFGRRDLS